MQDLIRRSLLSWKVCAATAWVLTLAVGSAHGQTGGESSVGYIDSAIPRDQFRLRFDAANDDNSPERADFFYSKNAPGPATDSHINFQEFNAYLELAANSRLSGFIELPYRFLQPDVNSHENGLGDLNFGFKFALLSEEDRVLTFQFRAYTPTADGLRGLGTHNWNVEPALLFYQRLSDKLTFEAEFRDFMPVYAYDDFAGNVVRYGVGVSYLVYEREKFRVAPVVEMVGWTVLSGKEDTSTGEVSAAGDQIVNAKVGVRFFFGEADKQGEAGEAGEASESSTGWKSDLYLGYGRSLTGAVWYKNIVRVEYRLRF
jgi:hypothetical protein